MATINQPAGTAISVNAAPPTAYPASECHTCRQITNYSPNLWMCVGDSDATFDKSGNQRRSDVVWTSDGSSGSKDNAAYVNDPFGYDRLAPVDKNGQPLSAGGRTAVQSAATCLAPFTQVTADIGKAKGGQLANLTALVSPFDTVDPTQDPGTYLTLFAHTVSACERNIGTCPTNQAADFQAVGGENTPADISDNHDDDNDCDGKRGTFVQFPADAPAPAARNFTYGAFDTSRGVSTNSQGWQNRQSILSLSPGLGANWQGSRYLEEGAFGCSGGCHGDTWGC